ncbi:universal stress protein [Caballeronia sp. BR00000012568055]|uniref:universal stress protein n=1 Tax=Caballeronia sp. BR00000012568055 TaxID=2918761 RepID=UPI0023F9D649
MTTTLSPYSRILVPMDGSAIASRALDEALTLARGSNALIQVLFVIDAPPVSARAGPYCYQDFHDACQREGEAICAEAELRMEQADVRGNTRIVEVSLGDDDLAHRILSSAEEFLADLVVMGTHGRRGWRRLMLGSVAERFLRLSRCAVLLVPARNEMRSTVKPSQSAGSGADDFPFTREATS